MKSQDIGILLKLVSLQIKETQVKKYLKESSALHKIDFEKNTLEIFDFKNDGDFEKDNIANKNTLKTFDFKNDEDFEKDNIANKNTSKLFNSTNDWRDWDDDLYAPSKDLCINYELEPHKIFGYSVRELANETGISKTQVSLSLQRVLNMGLARRDRKTGIPRVNTQAFLNFILHAVRYVFPAKPGEITRGIATAFSAPVLEKQLYSSGELPMVWPDARGKSKGQAIEPIFKSVTYAIRHDKDLYAMLALIDAIRIGFPRENKLSGEMLSKYMEL